MSWANFLISDSDSRRIEEYKRSIDKDIILGEGQNKSVYRASRGEVVKPIKDNPMENSFLEDLEQLEQITGFPRTEIYFADMSDIGLWSNTALVVQELAEIDHDRALNLYGWEETLDRVVGIFDQLNNQGFAYCDSKPENIGFVRRENELEARPIDVLDNSAYYLLPSEDQIEEDQRDIFISNVAHQFDLYLFGDSSHPGNSIESLNDSIDDEVFYGDGELPLVYETIERSENMEEVEYQTDPLSTLEKAVREGMESIE